MNELFVFVITFIIALGLNRVLTPIIIKLSHKNAWYDNVEERKLHTGNMPHAGGIGIFLSFCLAVIIGSVISSLLTDWELLPFGKILLFLTIYLTVHVTGVVDDFTHLRARYKLLLQILAAAFIVFSGHTVHSIAFPWQNYSLSIGPLSYAIIVIWFAGASNAVNFIDGMDGFAGGITSIASAFLGAIFIIQGNYFSALFAIASLGATTAFLMFNWPPAKIFMGDSGALFLGFFLSSIVFLENNGDVSLLNIVTPISLLIIPLYDTFASIIRRFRKKVGFYTPDKQHTHHKLIELGLSQRHVLFLMYFLSMLPGSAILLWAIFDTATWPFWLVLISYLLVGLFFLFLDIVYRRRTTPN